MNQPLPLVVPDAFGGQVEQPCKIADFITHERLRVSFAENSKAGLSFFGMKSARRFSSILSQSPPRRTPLFFNRAGACIFRLKTV